MEFIGQFHEQKKSMELDLLNRKIMYLLGKNARYSESSIAKALKTSKEVVHYRIKRMQEDGFLHGFITVVDPEKLGLVVHAVHLHLFPSSPHEALIELLVNEEKVTNVKYYNSPHEMQFSVATCSTREFSVFWHEFLNKHHAHIKDYSLSTILEDYFLGLDFLVEPSEQPEITEHKGSSFQKEFAQQKNSAAALDEKDYQILEVLQMNSRMPVIKIAQEMRLAPGSVQRRLASLIEGGIIKHFIPYASFTFLGYQWYRLHLRTKNLNEPSFLEYLKQHPQVVWMSKRLGKWNYDLSIFSLNNTEFNQVVKDLHTHLGDSLIDYEPAMVFKQLKYKPRVR